MTLTSMLEGRLASDCVWYLVARARERERAAAQHTAVSGRTKAAETLHVICVVVLLSASV